MLAWCALSPVYRSGKSRPRSVTSWAKEVWRKVWKTKAQWLQLALSFDLDDSTPWSPSPLPRPASLQSVPCPCLNPDPPTETSSAAHGSIIPLNIRSTATVPMGRCSLRCLCHSFLLQISSDGGRDQEISFVLRNVTLLWWHTIYTWFISELLRRC